MISTKTDEEGGTEHSPLILTLPNFSLAEVMEKIALTNKDWSFDRLRAAEQDYRNFLAQAKSRMKRLAPSADVDEVWHTHIIFTQQYHADCELYFGYYLHHLPSLSKDVTKGPMCTPPCVCVQPEIAQTTVNDSSVKSSVIH